MLTVDPETGLITFAAEDWSIPDWRMVVEADGRRLDSRQADLSREEEGGLSLLALDFDEAGLNWRLHVESNEDAGALIIVSFLENMSSAPIALGKATVLETDGLEGFSAPDDDVVELALPGRIARRSVRRVNDPGLRGETGRTVGKIKTLYHNRTRGRSALVGFLSFSRANTEIEREWREDGTIGALRVSCDFAGWELAPGERVALETFVLTFGPDPHALLEEWAENAAPVSKARVWEDAPIGWIGWSWVDAFNSECYEDVVLRNLEAVRGRLAGFGVNYCWISIGNLADGYPGAWLDWNYDNFPNGPVYLRRRLDELGIKWGLWCGPFWMCEAVEHGMEELEGALLRNEDGSLYVSMPHWRYGEAAKLPVEERPCLYALDTSHPAARDFLRETFAVYRRWGVRYYMIDFLYAGAGNICNLDPPRPANPAMTPGPEVYSAGLQAIREGAGDDTYLLGSSGPTVHNTGFVDATRVGNDFGEGRAIDPGCFFYPASYVINNPDCSTGARFALMNMASAWYTHRRLYLNDAGNVLTVDQPLSMNDARIHATIHALSGGPTMIGDDVDRMSDERLALIKKTLPRPRDVARPVDLFDTPDPDHAKVFHRRVEAMAGEYDVVAVFNFGEDLLRESVDLAALGLSEDRDYLVWEFWNEAYAGRARGTLEAVVPPGQVCVYRLVEDTGRPTLLGTDMHVLMGEVEILDCDWDEEAMTLDVNAFRPSGERGSVFIHAPEGLCVEEPAGLWIAKDGRDGSLVIRCELDFDYGADEWSVSFAPIE